METSFYLQYVVMAFVISAGIAALAAPLSIRIANKYGIIDKPKDARRAHKKPKPRFGGVAIVLGATAAMIIPANMNREILVAMLGGILMYGVGALDDIVDIKPLTKFILQFLIASFVYGAGIRITFISNYFGSPNADVNANVILGAGVAYLLTVFWIVGVTNAINLMDGLDGLAAGSAAIMSASLAYIAYIHGMRLGAMPVCIALVAVAGACVGFLPYNFAPAKTFMGDGGALYLGYMIAVLSVISPLKRATVIGAIIPIMTLAVPLFDTGMAMLRRTLKHESIMHADRGHLHHHLMAAGFGQRRSVLVIYGIVGIMGMVAVLISRELYKDAFFLAMVALLYLGIIMIPRRSKKGITRIITQDVMELEKQYFVEYLNAERERRKQEKDKEGIETSSDIKEQTN